MAKSAMWCKTPSSNVHNTWHPELLFFYDLRRGERGPVSTVLERLRLENYRKRPRDQPSEAQLSLPTCTHLKSENIFRLWLSCFLKSGKASFHSNLLNFIQNKQRGTQTKNEGKPSFRRRHNMFKTVPTLQVQSCSQKHDPGAQKPWGRWICF